MAWYETKYKNSKLTSVIEKSQHALADIILIALTIAGFPTLLASIGRSLDIGWQPSFSVHIVLYVATLFLTLIRKHVPNLVKQVYVVSGLLMVGVIGTISFGLYGQGVILLTVFAIVSSAFFGIRTGIVAGAIAVCVVLVTGYGYSNGILVYQFDANEYVKGKATWLSSAVVVTFFTGLALITLANFYKVLSKTISSEEKTENLLQSFLAAMIEAIIVYDSQGNIIYFNEAADELFKLAKQNNEKRNVDSIKLQLISSDNGQFADDKNPLLVPLQTRLTCNNQTIGIKTDKHSDARWCLLNTQLVQDDGQTQGVVATFIDISEQKNTQEALRQNEKLFQLIAHSTNDMISIHNEKGDYIYVSPSCENLLGYKPQELINRNAFDFIYEQDKEIVMHSQMEMLAGKKNNLVTYRLMKKNGPATWFESIVEMSEDEDAKQRFVVVSRDVSARKELESTIREKEKQLRTITDALPNLVSEIGRDLKYRYVNQAYELWYAKPWEQIIDQNIEQVIGEQNFQNVLPYLQQAFKGEETSFEKMFSFPGDLGRWMWIRYIPRIKDGEVDSVISVSSDISEIKKAQQDREQLRTELTQAQKMESIGQLTGGIAHDFNNMLASILGYAELSLKSKFNEEKKEEFIENIIVAARRAADLVDKLLAFSRGKKADLNQVRLELIVGESLEMLKSIMPSSIKMNVEFKNDDLLVMADAIAMNQVVVNLCINARDAMQGKGTLDINIDSEYVEADECDGCHNKFSGNYAVISVRDSGAGMPKEIAERIFEPFFTTKAVGKGSGMGLSMVHGIVHEHNGHVVVNSEIGQGTEFRIYIPQAENTQQQHNVYMLQDMQNVMQAQPDKINILVVDDEVPLVDLISIVLRDRGYHVSGYTNSVKAWEEFRKNKQGYDLVITDQTMPNMTGLDLANAIWEEAPDVPVILMSGFSHEVDESSAHQLGFNAYLKKPVAGELLIKTVTKVLDDINLA